MAKSLTKSQKKEITDIMDERVSGRVVSMILVIFIGIFSYYLNKLIFSNLILSDANNMASVIGYGIMSFVGFLLGFVGVVCVFVLIYLLCGGSFSCIDNFVKEIMLEEW